MKSRLLAAVGAVVLFASGAAAHAATYEYAYSGPDGSFDFIDSSTPTPITTGDDAFALAEIGTFDGIANDGFEIAFFTTDGGGGLTANDDAGSDSVNNFGPQLFSGTTGAPVFAPGVRFTSTQGQGDADDGAFTVTDLSAVSAAPEPATWALMLAGVAMIGGMLRFGRRRRLIGAATA